MLHTMLTQELQVDPPPVLAEYPIENTDGVFLNDYLLELQRVPDPILQAFCELGWSYHIDCAYLAQMSERLDMTCIGAAVYSEERIYVSEAGATLHEFGHFLDYTLDFPDTHQALYEAESEAAARLMRNYSKTNSREFFADCFAYWIRNHDNLEKFKTELPATAAYFEQLETGNWCE